jgi:hypothetical protein
MEATALVTQHAITSNREAAESAAKAVREATEAWATMSKLANDLATTAKAGQLAHYGYSASETAELVAPPPQPLPAGGCRSEWNPVELIPRT